MADLDPERKNIQVEETRFKYAVSESWAQKIGKSINFINDKQHSEKQFFLNGRYAAADIPFLGADGLCIFNYDAEILNVYAFNLEAGGGGTTELDIKRTTASGGAFTSIFSTTPKIASTAGNWAYVGIGDSGTGLTAPVFASVNDNDCFEVDAGDALRFDILTAQSDRPRSCGVIVHYRPR